MSRFENKIALVTGAASGIGRASAIQLAREGAGVMLADIDEAGMAETAASIAELGGKSESVVFDACSAESCKSIVDETVARFGQLNIVCNIAGIVSFWHLEEMSNEIWERSLAINLTAPMIISRESMPHLVKTQGNIVNMSSTAGRGGQAYNSIYAATKYGLTGLTKSLALEFASKKVRVNAICPGAVATPLNQKLRWAENMEEKLVQRLMPLIEEPAAPEEVALLVAYLASDDARFVTGVDWPIDGGQTA